MKISIIQDAYSAIKFLLNGRNIYIFQSHLIFRWEGGKLISRLDGRFDANGEFIMEGRMIKDRKTIYGGKAERRFTLSVEFDLFENKSSFYFASAGEEVGYMFNGLTLSGEVKYRITGNPGSDPRPCASFSSTGMGALQ